MCQAFASYRSSVGANCHLDGKDWSLFTTHLLLASLGWELVKVTSSLFILQPPIVYKTCSIVPEAGPVRVRRSPDLPNEIPESRLVHQADPEVGLRLPLGPKSGAVAREALGLVAL